MAKDFDDDGPFSFLPPMVRSSPGPGPPLDCWEPDHYPTSRWQGGTTTWPAHSPECIQSANSDAEKPIKAIVKAQLLPRGRRLSSTLLDPFRASGVSRQGAPPPGPQPLSWLQRGRGAGRASWSESRCGP